MRRHSRIVSLLTALALQPANADDTCAEKLRAFDYMLTVSKFSADGAAKMFAAREAALAHQKAGRLIACVRVLTEALGR